MRRSKKNRILKVIVICLAATAVIVSGTVFFRGRVSQLEEELKTLTNQLSERDKAEFQVLCTSRNMKAGESLNEDCLSKVAMPADAIPESVLSDAGMICGRVAVIDIPAGCWLTESMLADATPGPGERELEYGGIILSGTVAEGDTVDIRIVYPDGCDYIVLSKKSIRRLSEDRNSLLLCVDEEELLRMDSALTDMKLYPGTVIYAAGYIERGLQPAAMVNYTPSVKAIELIGEDPNIDVAASAYLRVGDRLETERRLDNENN